MLVWTCGAQAACRRQYSEVVCSRWRDDQLAFATAGKGGRVGGGEREARMLLALTLGIRGRLVPAPPPSIADTRTCGCVHPQIAHS